MMALFLGCVWLLAFVSKIQNLDSFTQAVAENILFFLPSHLATLLARTWWMLEGLLGLGLFLHPQRRFFLLWSLILLMLATLALLLSPSAASCGCFGGWLPPALEIPPGSVLRNLTLLALTAFALHCLSPQPPARKIPL
jgi:hypothetical protein